MSEPSGGPSRGSYILVVEDDAQVRRMVAEVLTDEGWEVRVARHGLEALDQARAQEPALVVLDINLPLMRGERVAQELHGMYDGIPILVITASGRVVDYATAARAFGYLAKPFDIDRLAAAVRQGLARGRQIEHRLEQGES